MTAGIDHEALAERILERARSHGADQAEVGVQTASGLSAEVRLGEVDALEYHRDKGCSVTVYLNGARGSASTSDFSDEAVDSTVAKACTLARRTSPDPANGLADPDKLATEIPDLDLDHPAEMEPEEAIERARACEAAARAVDGRISNSEGGEFSWSRGTVVYANSHGFLGGYSGTRFGVSAAVVAEEGGSMQRDFWYATARDLAELEDGEAVGRRAGERTARRLGARRISTARVPVLFEAPVASSLLGHLVGAVRGSNLYRRSSFLVDAAGEQVFTPGITIREEPHRPKGLGSAPFDGEGVGTRQRDLVADGVLTGYCLDSYSARKLGMETTGHAGGVHNLYLLPGEHDPQALLREMGTGLLVTELIGMGVNNVTGDYSRGAAGFWVEDGEIAYPVEEITIAGNLKDMFKDIAGVGNDLELRGNVSAPSVLIGGMTVAGQ
ncbi:MAG: metalloprotease PmbA [Thiohalorhabdus sp.]|uniref:metalloprotease PmbA n=1 Tax=Thiohalorhabdus sp. TaxID=3094134 RepID=UPI0039815439